MYNIGHGFLKILKFTTLLYKELINLFLPKKHRVRAKSEFNKILSIGLTPKLLVNSLNVIFPNANEIIANINSNIQLFGNEQCICRSSSRKYYRRRNN